VWDHDLREYNNPLPRWWLWLFYITVVFGLLYLVLYPGLGAFAGLRGWTQERQYNEESAAVEARASAILAPLAAMPVSELARNAQAMSTARNLYLQDCAQCHGSDGGGGAGPRLAGKVADDFPDVEDQIAFVTKGKGGMPAFGGSLSAADIRAVVEYTRSGLGG